MDEAERNQYEARSTQIRADLKQFESEWARSHDGSKPSRDDIKRNPDIASKYKEYNQLRDRLTGNGPAPKARKRKSDDRLVHTPSKRCRTPKTARTADILADAFETPSIRRLFSPAMPTSIGPTPQKNGRVLGIFDLLDEDRENAPPRQSDSRIQATPSKASNTSVHDLNLTTTPSKHLMTPMKQKNRDSLGAKTPSTSSRLQLSTPAFLRRAPMQPLKDDDHLRSPAPLRLPRKPLGRTLSSVVAGLRQLEEERLDQDLEALREMENEAESLNGPKPTVVSQPGILEPDSQAHQLLGGLDDEALYDSPPESRPGQPSRVYKKKGQKRTTRRANMRPVRTNRPRQSTRDAASGMDQEADDDDVIPETQARSNPPLETPPNLDSDSDFHDENEGDGEAQHQRSKKPEVKATADKKEGKAKKAVKKFNELAHANFKRLKLKNTGSKGGPGVGSRFRRRR